jgi:hypothetical protein
MLFNSMSSVSKAEPSQCNTSSWYCEHCHIFTRIAVFQIIYWSSDIIGCKKIPPESVDNSDE